MKIYSSLTTTNTIFCCAFLLCTFLTALSSLYASSLSTWTPIPLSSQLTMMVLTMVVTDRCIGLQYQSNVLEEEKNSAGNKLFLSDNEKQLRWILLLRRWLESRAFRYSLLPWLVGRGKTHSSAIYLTIIHFISINSQLGTRSSKCKKKAGDGSTPWPLNKKRKTTPTSTTSGSINKTTYTISNFIITFNSFSIDLAPSSSTLAPFSSTSALSSSTSAPSSSTLAPSTSTSALSSLPSTPSSSTSEHLPHQLRHLHQPRLYPTFYKRLRTTIQKVQPHKHQSLRDPVALEM